MQLVVLASGKGSRLKHLTKNKPKCFIKIKNLSLINHLKKIFSKFEKVIIITGYKSSVFEKLNLGNNVIFIKNYNFRNTNMVYSLFCAKKFINRDVVICYSDILFDQNIISKMIKFNFSHIPINKNWVNFWRKRMKYKFIKDDAESLNIKNKYIVEIGQKILDIFPKYQFMGLLKLKNRDFKFLSNLFKKLKDNNIDMTNFLNYSINNHNFKLKYFLTKRYWYEIDTVEDYKIVNKLFKFK